MKFNWRGNSIRRFLLLFLFAICLKANSRLSAQTDKQPTTGSDDPLLSEFSTTIRPLISRYCTRCHNGKVMESGIRLDRMDGSIEDSQIAIWSNIRQVINESNMPPEEEKQPTPQEKKTMLGWIERLTLAAKTTPRAKNGSIRRLTVEQYQNTIEQLLSIQENYSDLLPPDARSRDGFLNNQTTLELSPLLVESYFDIAERALDVALVQKDSVPVIQNFRMRFGNNLNPNPINQKLILGANSQLLRNQDFIVEELVPQKDFRFTPLKMRTRYRFHEGYSGNSTVRGWRDYDSLYHAVFACMRGNSGYPRGLAYEVDRDGLLLRSAIPSAEIFGVESTYGPRANFKISLRELPDHGNFRIKVVASKYDDAMLLDRTASIADHSSTHRFKVDEQGISQVELPQEGIYQADVYLKNDLPPKPDHRRLTENLTGKWNFNDGLTAEKTGLKGQLSGAATIRKTDFGKSLDCDGKNASLVVARDPSMNVGQGDFSVAAWIYPRKLKQSGIVCLGKYSWTQGWYLDMPRGGGVLRIESAKKGFQSNGTVQTGPGMIVANRWQHVCAVVKRSDKTSTNNTRLYINGYEVAAGNIGPADLDNQQVSLHIGRIQEAQVFDGQIDEVHLFRRAISPGEIQALVEPGKKHAVPPRVQKRGMLTLEFDDRKVSDMLNRSAFLVSRFPKGKTKFRTTYTGGGKPIGEIRFTRLEPESSRYQRFLEFEKRDPELGVHLGLRRDCGSTLNRVGNVISVANKKPSTYIFEGAINNFPRPLTQKENDNYLAGIREIAVRHEYSSASDAPRLKIHSVEFEGPFYPTWPPPSHRSLNPVHPTEQDSTKQAENLIRRFASRAFRRPVTESETRFLMKVWSDSYKESKDFQASLKDCLAIIMTSPQMLFLTETSQSPKPEPLSPYELASKLSYFLWNSPPDEQLLNLAKTGTLSGKLPDTLDRMVEDPKFDRFAEAFVSQWLDLEKLDTVETDRRLYPRLTQHVKTSLKREPIELFKHLVRKNLSVRQLIDSQFVFANDLTAEYYRLEKKDATGLKFIPVRHGRKELGGILSQAGILAGLSDGKESNPIKRGAWFARKIIARPPDDPPPNVPNLEESGDQSRTLRERLEAHRNQQGCAACHAKIDPWGLPFEQFDAGGLPKKTFDAFSTLPGNQQVRNLVEFKKHLSQSEMDQIAFSLLKHLATYATGRSLSYNELEYLKRKSAEFRSTHFLLRDMLLFVVNSPIFLEK